MKPNIIIITCVFPPEPVAESPLMKDLAEELSKKCNVTVLCPVPSRSVSAESYNNRKDNHPYDIVELDSYYCPESKLIGRFRESYSMGVKCREYIKKNASNIDLIYNGGWPFIGHFIVARAAKKLGIPYIATVQDIYPESIGAHLPKGFLADTFIKALLPIEKHILKNSIAVHTISHDMANYLAETRQVSKEKFIVVRNWKDEEEFIKFQKIERSSETSVSNEKLTFMYLGNVGYLAGLDIVLDAFKKANLEGSRLVIAGDGSAKNALAEQVKANSIKNVEFWTVPLGKVPETQNLADIMILPIKKGFASHSIPSKLPSYMLSKKPVLASVDGDSDSAKCIVESKGGWIVNAEDVDALALQMKKCHGYSKKELKEMGELCFDYAMQNLSKSTNLHSLVKSIERLLPIETKIQV